MSSPTPFQVAREIGTNLSSAFRESRDQNAIDRILSESMSSGDPAVLQNSIGKILSQVAPERQGAAVQFLQNRYSQLQEQQQKQQQQAREKEAGLVPGINPAAQAAIYKEGQKGQRLAQYGLGGQTEQIPQGAQPALSAQPQLIQSPFRNLSEDQLVMASGAPDREISEPAKAELKRRQEERKVGQKEKQEARKSHTEISQEVLKENEKEARSIVEAESALGLMESAISGKDLSFWSPDNLAEVTGIEAFRSPEGALFKTAGKEFFLGTLNRAGARPNQFIEKQIIEMLPKIGRSTAANLSVARAFRNEIDLKREKIRLTRDLADELESELGYVPRNIGQLRDKKLKEYAEAKQKELNNDLRAYKSIDDRSKPSFMKVESGTPISKVVAKALLDQYDRKDPDRAKKAAKQAKELGYTF